MPAHFKSVARLLLLGAVAAAAPTLAGTQGSTSGSGGFTGGTLIQTKFVYSSDPSELNPDGSSTIPGMTTTISVPTGTTALVLAEFGAVSSCSHAMAGDSTTGTCEVKILLGGKAMEPSANPTAFDTPDAAREGPNSHEAHQITRARVVGAGTYNIKVVGQTNNPGGTGLSFVTSNRTLTIWVIQQ